MVGGFNAKTDRNVVELYRTCLRVELEGPDVTLAVLWFGRAIEINWI